MTVAALAASSPKRADEEIAKCDVLCANCHAIEHYGKDDEGANTSTTG